MENQKTRIAIAYDFDGTLARGSLPEHGLLQDLGIESASFWNEVKEYAEKQDADEILTYMCLLIEKAKERGIASYPAVSINYTTKTQYLFRINKGIFNFFDNKRINTWIRLDRRPYPFKRIIYIGDGDTDIPAMKMTRYQGGYSIAVFDPFKWNDLRQQEKIYKLIAEDRVQYVAPAVYSEGSLLDITVKGIIGKIANAL
ncbi:MAG: hypothetical protein ACPLYX_09655 [Rectinema subterraneum]|uniref:hypothetical protein n=1 Tax=Rectinema subterraneum TaxID=2653714 RepID=UPI003C7C6A26